MKRRRQRQKQRAVRLYRLSSSSRPATAAAAFDTARSPWRWSSSPANIASQPAANDSIQVEFNPNYTSLELSLGLTAVEHDLNEIPDDSLVITRSVNQSVQSINQSINPYSQSVSQSTQLNSTQLVPHDWRRLRPAFST